ncbi:hypothetical protein L9F63_000588, partial [Diploptera punctata]
GLSLDSDDDDNININMLLVTLNCNSVSSSVVNTSQKFTQNELPLLRGLRIVMFVSNAIVQMGFFSVWQCVAWLVKTIRYKTRSIRSV